ncbi:NAD-dependent deacylase [Lutimonas halocynthiae]|uniref:SIR2 family NAD-dependent protein deacylase n=1 Tax=Lutimonas halocynthiae TaxID=1446477 RepID=UPI0025B2F975|nr:NAD-dependent deacylase [Lutimonas halocynthiae]MDN3643712.1 NAD-dependent deacylase [Lutimonas halocynthiae]
MKKLVVLTGAGMSAESGINTFRDADGLWEGHNVMDVASPEGWYRDQDLVLDFYNQRRKQLLEVEPNYGHESLAQLQATHQVKIVTQNVDDLHERAGSKNVLHLHGELRKVRSTLNEELVYSWEDDLNKGDLCELNSQLRPHIVWFGEAVPMLERAIEITAEADMLLIIGTSMQVYPAASLINYIKSQVPIYFIDPRPAINSSAFENLTIIPEKATIGMEKFMGLISL